MIENSKKIKMMIGIGMELVKSPNADISATKVNSIIPRDNRILENKVERKIPLRKRNIPIVMPSSPVVNISMTAS